ncbi:unnamed protein product [Arabis nemorensis]|uniref:Uncharacterized protein n=1 Tax=Arabis nemorensis TaxID=586526 RepID=A0A565CBI1_9BRAS|nr:unnamed protein product [Arabis nemorensis]
MICESEWRMSFNLFSSMADFKAAAIAFASAARADGTCRNPSEKLSRFIAIGDWKCQPIPLLPELDSQAASTNTL